MLFTKLPDNRKQRHCQHFEQCGPQYATDRQQTQDTEKLNNFL